MSALTSSILITEQAAAVLAEGSNGFFAPKAPVIWLDAVPFRDPGFLGGPFKGRYGLVYLAHEPDARPLQVLLDEVEAQVFRDASTVYLPPGALARITERYPTGVAFYWHEATKQAFSELDLPHLDPALVCELARSPDPCAAFANTPQGRAELFKDVTADELAQHSARLTEAVRRVHEDMREVVRCAERPYSVRLQGNDDASWTCTFATRKDAEAFIRTLRREQYAAVRARMRFTN